MITQNELLIKIAEVLNDGRILDDVPSWIAEVQITENVIRFRVDLDDYHSSKQWFELKIAPVV